MQDLSISPNAIDRNLEQVVAHDLYNRLRDKLVNLKLASEPNMVAIDATMAELQKAQCAYKATHGLIGNNPQQLPEPIERSR